MGNCLDRPLRDADDECKAILRTNPWMRKLPYIAACSETCTHTQVSVSLCCVSARVLAARSAGTGNFSRIVD
eukprot:6214046-Pleurochrysis_carterae.AAC.1